MLKYEGFPSAEVTQIPQHGERKEKKRVFYWATSTRDGKKKECKIRVGAGVSVGWRVVVVGDPGWSGKRNVGLLECLEQSGIIE